MADLEKSKEEDRHQRDDAEGEKDDREFLAFAHALPQAAFGFHGLASLPQRGEFGQWLEWGWHRGNVPKVPRILVQPIQRSAYPASFFFASGRAKALVGLWVFIASTLR